MKTRSQPYSVDIDFDEASRFWMANKKKKGPGHYVYQCCHCNRACMNSSTNTCRQHMQPKMAPFSPEDCG